jgi:hypothetical protein
MDSVKNLAVIPFDKAEDFLNYLRPGNYRWLWHYPGYGGPDISLPSGTTPWSFRGHKEANWKLVPAAWRPNALQKVKERKRTNLEFNGYNEDTIQRFELDKKLLNSFNQIAYQIEAELYAVREFIESSNTIGLRIPDGSKVREYNFHRDVGNYLIYIANLFNRVYETEASTLPIANTSFALAQHHGLPTRLLDWSSHPLVVAYFAACSVKSDDLTGSLAVWALRDDALYGLQMSKFTVDRSEHEFLHAQHGLFMYFHNPEVYFLKHGEWPSIESAMEDFLPVSSKQGGFFKKITLPKSQAGELLRLLWAENITHAHLMPSYKGVSEALAIRWNWFNSVKLSAFE